MDLLLDVNVILDLCAPRIEWHEEVSRAVEKCRSRSHRLWLHAGSVQTLIYNLCSEIRQMRPGVSMRAAMRLALEVLEDFSRDKHWIASLADDGAVFRADDPEDAQLLRALGRFPEGSIRLLTRDEPLLGKHPEKTISPKQYCRLESADSRYSFIDLGTQQDQIRPKLEINIHRVLHHGNYILGPEIKELEQKLARFAGVRHAITCSSGTDALLMPLMAKGVGPGDAVFTTPFTFIATAEVISLLGATPIFVDIDPRTFNMDPAKLELAVQAVKMNDPTVHPLPRASNLKPQTALIPKAVIPVDLFGLPADYDPIMALAREHDLFVLGDSAQGFGGEYKGRRVGGLAHVTTTSFFPAKPLGCYGDGGAILTDDDELAEKLFSIRVHGKGRDKYDNVRIGLNARMDTLQAAILLPKLDIFPEELEARQRVAKKYTQSLDPLAMRLTPPFIPRGMRSAWAQYSILAGSRELRATIQDQLKKEGVPTMVYYPTPLHMQTAFSILGHHPEDFPVSMETSQRIFSLPMHPYLQPEMLENIVSRMEKILS